jgi:UDP-N-acetylglucosamine 4,6-dehydratase/5-epimerase
MLDDKTILITGGTGSFGNAFVKKIFENHNPKKVIIYSRDEYKQFVMKKSLPDYEDRIRFFIGDVRDRERLYLALSHVDYVVHAAALKQVPACEYNPSEAIRTNITGAENVIDAAIRRNVSKVVALSTDKAVNPVNLYGATKLASDKLFIAANAYSAHSDTIFSVVRYGNVAGSRGSVIPFFKNLIDKESNHLPITDDRMTRFWITLDEAVDLVFKALNESKGGETYISKIPSFKIPDLAQAMAPETQQKTVGIREGEKLHEVMITETDSAHSYEYDNHYIIYPDFEWWTFDDHFTAGGKKVEESYRYASDTNAQWLNVEQLRERVAEMDFSHH